MKQKMNKKGAMEMSVGTIVTIVLLMGVLVLGVFLIQRIFTSAKGAIDLTDEQLRNEINKLFAEESKISVYPGTRLVEIKQESTNGVGLGIKNLLSGTAGTSKFFYETIISDPDLQTKCGITEQTASRWIVTGRAENDIQIASGDFSVQRVVFEIPVGAPLCTIRYRINVCTEKQCSEGGESYATDFFDMKVKAK